MSFRVDDGIEVLTRTPATLDALLRGTPPDWHLANEGPDTFSAFDNVGHLIHGERTDWIPRMRRILEHGTALPFDKFDRFAMVELSRGRTIEDLLDEFAALRRQNVEILRATPPSEADLEKRGTHPGLGTVTLSQLLAAWVVHDLGHVAQVARVMAKRYTSDVGPWTEYLPVLTRR